MSKRISPDVSDADGLNIMRDAIGTTGSDAEFWRNQLKSDTETAVAHGAPPGQVQDLVDWSVRESERGAGRGDKGK